LPWVRLHGVKDYLDMVEILSDYPTIRQVFNMVPSLLEQIVDYAEGKAADPHLELSRKNAAAFNDDDKAGMIELFFQANYDNLIAPMWKYKSLYNSRNDAINDWNESDWRDLQCLANLAWIDPSFKTKGRLKDLVEKGERYTEEEKNEILEAQREIIARIIPTLKDYMQNGQIEVSVTPYFHPIMPLLYDTSSALVAMPHSPMPKTRFAHPEDVDRQVEMAVDFYGELFGRSPVGMWPSEGSVSEEILPILKKHGIQWIATDEEILSETVSMPARLASGNSLISTGNLYRGYRFDKEDRQMAIFFRDHALSDNVGFVYSRWDPEKAADDFINKLKAIHENVTRRNIADPIVSVILDGENAWEYYRNDGRDFLNALYSGISRQSWLKTTTYEDFLSSGPKTGKLTRLFPGSWINHNFSVWIGHEEDNKAWDLLSKARGELIEYQELKPDHDKDKLALAWREIYIAEGSDWCWWFGDDHVGPHNDEFDSLYRSHLANVYLATGREPPQELFNPVRSDFILAHIFKPVDYITPIIDGHLTHFYEWDYAGYFDCAKAGSTMHKSENLLKGIWYGFDTENLYLMLKPAVTVDYHRFKQLYIEIEFLEPQKGLLAITDGKGSLNLDGKAVDNFTLGWEHILEFSIPLSEFVMNAMNRISIRIFIKEGDKILESWPPADSLVITIPKEGSGEIPWIV